MKKKREIKFLNVDEIVPYSNNPRDNKNAIEKVRKSIEDFGFNQPIVVDENNIVIVGHTRLEASKELGLELVPCIVASDLTQDEAKAYRLVDNKTSEFSYWDYELLQSELDELSNVFDMEDFGFRMEEIDYDALEDLFGQEQVEKEKKVKCCPHCGKEI